MGRDTVFKDQAMKTLFKPLNKGTPTVHNEEKNAKSEEMRQLKDLFGLYDTDNSGSINKEELKLLMNSLGFYPSEQLIEQMIIDNDVDGDQLIDFEEFVQMAERYKKEEVATPHKGLRDAFNVLDKDKSNTLNPDEFRAVITRLGGETTKIKYFFKVFQDKPLNDNEVDEILQALGLSRGDDIPIEKIIELFSEE